jgi:membrane protease YdiL (CAAX protease family)
MPTLPDLIFVVSIAVVGPLLDYALFWPAQRRLARADPVWARRWLWASAVGNPWTVVAFGAAIWLAHGRSWESFGFTVPAGWRLWAALGLVLAAAGYHAVALASLARSADARASLRRQVEPLAAVLPHTRSEMAWFAGVAVTAGFCEEFLFRGYLLWVLSPWLGWWGAAAVSLSIFAIGHVYQGWGGVVRTGIVGAAFTLVVAICGSLWPAIALHALIDLGQGTLAWAALRDEPEQGGAVRTAVPADPRPASGVESSPLEGNG